MMPHVVRIAALASLCCAAQTAPAAQPAGTDRSGEVTAEQLVAGMCDYYSKIDTLSVDFTESFEMLVHEKGSEIVLPVEVEGKWITRIDDERILLGPHAAPKRLHLSFLKGGESIVVQVPADDDSLRVLLLTWDGQIAQRLEQAFSAGRREPLPVAIGIESGGGPFEEHGVRISRFLLYHLQAGARAKFAKRYNVARTGLRIAETGTVAGVPAIKLSAKSPDTDVTWAMWIAPEHGYLVVRDEAYWTGQEQPFFVREVTRIRRFGELWFPTEGYIKNLAILADPESTTTGFDPENHFNVSKIAVNEPVDDATFRIQWPQNTFVNDWRSGTSYRVGASTRPALTTATGPAPAPAPATGWWNVELSVRIALVVVIGVATMALLRRRRASR